MLGHGARSDLLSSAGTSRSPPLVEMLESVGYTCGPTEDRKSEGRSLIQAIVVNFLVAKSAGIAGVPRQVSGRR